MKLLYTTANLNTIEKIKNFLAVVINIVFQLEVIHHMLFITIIGFSMYVCIMA